MSDLRELAELKPCPFCGGMLVWRDGRVEIAHWAIMCDDDGKALGGWWWTNRRITDREPQPTHWMPLPEPPAKP
jgi:hypothetical protein